MTKSESEWVIFMESILETEDFVALIVRIGMIEKPDEEDLAFLRKTVDQMGDLALAAVSIMATHFPESVDIKFDDPEKMQELVLKELKKSLE